MSLEKLIKCLGMMSSEFDNEALAAARMAQKELKKLGLRWEDVIKSPQQAQSVTPQPEAKPAAATTATTATAHPYHQGFGGFGNAMGGMGSPFSGPQGPFGQQYNPFAQQQAYAEAMRQQQWAEHQEAIRRQAELRRQAGMQNAYRPPEPAQESEIEIKISEREVEKRKGFWSRLQG